MVRLVSVCFESGGGRRNGGDDDDADVSSTSSSLDRRHWSSSRASHRSFLEGRGAMARPRSCRSQRAAGGKCASMLTTRKTTQSLCILFMKNWLAICFCSEFCVLCVFNWCVNVWDGRVFVFVEVLLFFFLSGFYRGVGMEVCVFVLRLEEAT